MAANDGLPAIVCGYRVAGAEPGSLRPASLVRCSNGNKSTVHRYLHERRLRAVSGEAARLERALGDGARRIFGVAQVRSAGLCPAAEMRGRAGEGAERSPSSNSGSVAARSPLNG